MANFKTIPLIFLSLLLLSQANSRYRTCRVSFVNSQQKRVNLTVEIADQDWSRMRGLMYRKRLAQNKGMLFVFPSAYRLNFWMKNTYIPLSIAYISSLGRINEIYDMKPLDTSVTYPARYPAQFAIEVNKGWFKKHKINRGCNVSFHGCISQ